MTSAMEQNKARDEAHKKCKFLCWVLEKHSERRQLLTSYISIPKSLSKNLKKEKVMKQVGRMAGGRAFQVKESSQCQWPGATDLTC